MAGERLLRPGVEVVQTFATPAPSFLRPTLVPCAVGPAFEVIGVLDDDGAVNQKAKFGAYRQLGKTITQSSFPDHRGNIDELNILEETIRSFMLSSGNLVELPMDPGESFLFASHGAKRAAIRSTGFGAGLALGGKALVFAVDQTVPTDPSADITVIFTGGTITVAEACRQINAAAGFEVATEVTGAVLQLASPTFGATSSITVRAGGSANVTLALGSATTGERVEGSGWRGQDDSDNDLVTPWVEFYRGDYLVNDVTIDPLLWSADDFKATTGLLDMAGDFTNAKAGAVTFGTGGTDIPLAVGDIVFADGIQVKAGEVMKVEATRFKVGTINPALSTTDSSGKYLKKVYSVAEVDTLLADVPFAPKYLFFRATGLDAEKLVPAAATATGTQAATAATKAAVTGTGATTAVSTGMKLHYVVTVDDVETEGTYVFTGPAATAADVVTALTGQIPGVTPTQNAGVLKLEVSPAGRKQAIVVKADGTANGALKFSTTEDTSGVGVDATLSLTGKLLQLRFDDNPHTFETYFDSDSIELAVDAINAAVGAPVASLAADGLHLVVTSPLKGKASKVTVVAGTAATAMGLPGNTTAGSGRPLPDAYLDDASNLVVGPEILRDPLTGYPLDQELNAADLFIQFKALRRDVTAVAKVPGVLRIPDQDTLAAVLDPISDENPLSLATFLMMVNAPSYEVKALGVDEITASAPDGTEPAYARALGLLESEEVYALAPLSQNETVHGMFATHAVVMSQPENGGERIVLIDRKMPLRKSAKIIASGSKANSTASVNELMLDTNPAAGLVAAKIDPTVVIPESAGLYVEFELAGTVVRYSVSNVSGPRLTLRTAPAANADGFFTTGTMDATLVDVPYALKVRGESLIIPGSNPPRLDYSLLAEVVAEGNRSLANRRVYSFFPETVKMTVKGAEMKLPGYYACAAYCGMIAAQPPQQPLTNFPTVGITGVVGTERFSKQQLDVMAGGGTFILMQDTPNSAVYCRQQVSTDLTSIETRELSITKSVDFVAKFLRAGVRKFIGTQTIGPELIDQIGTTIQGMLALLVDLGILNGASLNNLAQDAANPDTLLVDVTLQVKFPCNYIRITLEV